MKKSELYKISKEKNIKTSLLEKLIIKETGISKTGLFLLDEIESKYVKNILKNIERLENGEQIEYIIQKSEFYGIDFFIDNRVLIPRNDTEIMVKTSIETIIGIIPPSSGTLLKKGKNNGITLIDVGTGSSCIAISILKNTPNVDNCLLIDISKEALEVSKINIFNHNLENKIKQINSDLLSCFTNNKNLELLNGSKNILITANLPYIKNGDFENMSKETIKYEPDLALYGGEKTGFELYEKLISQVLELKRNLNINKELVNESQSDVKITLFIEIGFDQYEYSKKYLSNLNLNIEYFKDNSGINRCIKINI